MRLAVVTSYFPSKGQASRGQSAYQTLLRMRDRCEIEVFAPQQNYPEWFQPRNFPYVRADLNYQPEGVRATYFEYPAVPGFSRPFNGPLLKRLLLPRLAKFQPELILNYWLYPDGYAAAECARHLRIPVVLGSIGSDLNRIPDALTAWYTRRALSRATCLLTVSDHLRTQGLRLGMPAERIRTVHNGCDTTIFRPRDRSAERIALGLPQDAFLVLFVGWLSETKGLRELMAAFSGLVPRHPKLHLACIGSGPLQQELAAGWSGGLHLPGQLSSAQVASWMGAANLFCLPSYMEGCPNVVVEALASGRPVLSTRVGGVPELVDDPRKGTLVEPRNESALREALDQSITRNWDEPWIASAGRRDWQNAADETLKVCQMALRLGPR
jgi:teichuronic acid biosynthesis glycosyltransferase TuaC